MAEYSTSEVLNNSERKSATSVIPGLVGFMCLSLQWLCHLLTYVVYCFLVPVLHDDINKSIEFFESVPLFTHEQDKPAIPDFCIMGVVLLVGLVVGLFFC